MFLIKNAGNVPSSNRNRTSLFLRQIVVEKEKMQENTIKGTLTELQCQKDFIQRNILVSQPIVQDSRYDFIIDLEGKLYKIQCKSSSLSADEKFISLKTQSTNIRTMKSTYYTKDEIDFFYTCHQGVSYLIPVENAGKGETRLRFSSNQPNNPNIRWAKNYEIDLMLQKIKKEVNN